MGYTFNLYNQFFCPGKEAAMGSSVVSLTYTAYLCGAFITLCFFSQRRKRAKLNHYPPTFLNKPRHGRRETLMRRKYVTNFQARKGRNKFEQGNALCNQYSSGQGLKGRNKIL